jgi:CDP-diacylglycerol--serine O-phosphatidyltransferase
MSDKQKNKKPLFRRNKKSRDPYDVARRREQKEIRINKMKKGIFILPSLLTLTGIFFGFWAMVLAINGKFVLAAALIMAAAFFDGIDGKVARLTKTTTRFGVELDSLADVISFGVAPAIMMYMWVLEPWGRLGWVTAFVFVSCGALRLARFNVQHGNIDPKRFNGLPIPLAAIMLSSTVLFFYKLGLEPATLAVPLIVLVFVLAFLMVSTVKFYAFKDLTMVKDKPFYATVAFVLLLALIAVSPFIVPFLLCTAFVISGPVLTYMLHVRQKKAAREEQQADRQEEADPQTAT